jgi:hypothetical protein
MYVQEKGNYIKICQIGKRTLHKKRITEKKGPYKSDDKNTAPLALGMNNEYYF